MAPVNEQFPQQPVQTRKRWKAPTLTTQVIGVSPAVLVTCTFPLVHCSVTDTCAANCPACPVVHHC
jgi:hypothetical protein